MSDGPVFELELLEDQDLGEKVLGSSGANKNRETMTTRNSMGLLSEFHALP